jgi:hypothetical protein
LKFELDFNTLKNAMNESINTKPIEVYSGNPWQAGMVKTLLLDSEIEAFMQDEIMGTLNPWWTAPGGAGAIRVFVSETDFERAKKIVAEYERITKENK